MRKLLLLGLLAIHTASFGENNHEQREVPVTLTDKQFQQLLDNIAVQKQYKEPIISKAQVAKIMGAGIGVTALGYGIHTYKKELACTVALIVGASYIDRIGSMFLQAGPHIASACALLLASLSPKSSQGVDAVSSSAAQPVVDKIVEQGVNSLASYAGPNVLNEVAQKRLIQILKHIVPD